MKSKGVKDGDDMERPIEVNVIRAELKNVGSFLFKRQRLDDNKRFSIAGDPENSRSLVCPPAAHAQMGKSRDFSMLALESTPETYMASIA